MRHVEDNRRATERMQEDSENLHRDAKSNSKDVGAGEGLLKEEIIGSKEEIKEEENV
jgi:hypothetical protein